MLIPVIKEESLRQSEVVAYDPFVVSSRMVTGSTFLFGAPYVLGEEVFDGTYYHEVTTNDPHTSPFTSGTESPEWNTALGGYTFSGNVRFTNIGTSSRIYGRTDETIMRIGAGSFAFLQVTFPQSTTAAIEDAKLVLTAPVFSMASRSEVLLSPRISFEPSTVDFVLAGIIESDVIARGTVLTQYVNRGTEVQYADDTETAQLQTYASLEATLSPKTGTAEELSAFVDSTASLSAALLRTTNGTAQIETSSKFETDSLVVALVNSAYEPLDFETLEYPEVWPPAYVDTTSFRSVAVPRIGESVAIALDDALSPDRRTYTFVVFRSSIEILNSDNKVRDALRKPILIGGDQSVDIPPYVRPNRNPRTLTQTLGGPYRGYILDTYETEFGAVSPIPWFEASEAKRIAKRMTEVNFYGDDGGLEVKVEYNSTSQEFVFTETDFRVIDGIAQNGIQRVTQRIAPIRIGSKLLYPIGTYDIPWLMVQNDYNPNPIIRVKGAFPVTLDSSSSTVFIAQ